MHPAWVTHATELFQQHRDLRSQRVNDAIARVCFQFGHLSEIPIFAYRSDVDEHRCRTRYVRIHQAANEVTFLPHCSVPDSERVLDELALVDPWQLEHGAFLNGQMLRLRNAKGQHIMAHLEYYYPAELSAKSDWEDWLYARSLSTAYVLEQGYFVPLLGEPNTHRRDEGFETIAAEQATRGSPLALLLPSRRCRSSWLSAAVCERRQLLDPVETGSWAHCCGRFSVADLPAQDNPNELFALRLWRQELEAYGVDVERLLAGTAVTAFGHHIPQVNVMILARVIRHLGMVQPMRSRFLAMSTDPKRSWSNRFRAKILVAYLEGKVNDVDLGWDETVGTYIAEQLSQFVRTEAPSVDLARELDEQCAWRLLGVGDFGCISG